MGRKKVNLQWIANDASRRATFNKRSQALMKKTSELVKLCGVKACVVVYDENGAHRQAWPSVGEAREMFISYKEMPDVPQWKKNTTQAEYLQGCINRVQSQVERSDEESKDREAEILFHDAVAGRRPGLAGVTSDQLSRVSKLVEKKMKKVMERMRQLGIDPEQLLQQHSLQPQPQQEQQPPQQHQQEPHPVYAFNEVHRQASVRDPLRPQHNMLPVPSPATNLGYGAFASNNSGAGPSAGTTSLRYYGAFAGNSSSAGSTGNTSLGSYGVFAGNSGGAGPSTGNASFYRYGAFSGNSSSAGPSTANASRGYNGAAFAGSSSGAGPSNGSTNRHGGDIVQLPLNQWVWPWNSFFQME